MSYSTILSMEDVTVSMRYRNIKTGAGAWSSWFKLTGWSDDADVLMFNDSPPLASDRVGAAGDRVTFRNSEYGGEITFKFLPASYYGFWFMQKEVEERGDKGSPSINNPTPPRWEWEMTATNSVQGWKTTGTCGYLLTIPRGLTVGKENASNMEITIAFQTIYTLMPENTSNLVGRPDAQSLAALAA